MDSNDKTGSEVPCNIKTDVDYPAVENEELAVEEKPEELAVEEKTEEPASEEKVEELTVEKKLGEPVVEQKPEELEVEEILEEPSAKEKPEEQSREVTETPIREATNNQNANEASSTPPTTILGHPLAQGTIMDPMQGEPISIDEPKNVHQLDSREISEVGDAMQRDEDNMKQKDESSYHEGQKFTPQSE